MNKFLLCASMATVCMLSACDKAPETAQTPAATPAATEAVAPAKEAPAAEAQVADVPAAPAADSEKKAEVAAPAANDEMQLMVTVLEKAMPTDLGGGSKRGPITLSDDQNGIIIPISVAAAIDTSNSAQVEAFTTAMKVGMGAKFCKDGKPAPGAEKFLTDGRYMEFVVTPAGAAPISFKANEALCEELAK